jgi:Holliday junction resolvase RusA-like endonuclease
MTRVLTFWVEGRPVPKRRSRTVRTKFGKSRTITPTVTVRWEHTIRVHAMKACAGEQWRPIAARYEIDIVVHRARKQGDADNFLKSAKDALNKIVWPDDRMVMRAAVNIVDGDGQGMRVRITRSELSDVGRVSEPNLTGAE